MLKVAFICSSLIRKGPINVLYNILSNIDKSLIESIIVTISDEESDSRKHDFESLGVKVICLNLKKGIDSYIRSYKLLEVIEEEKPNICHSSGFRTDILCYKELRRKYIIVSSVYNYPFDDYVMQFGKIKGSLMSIIHFFILPKFNKVIACSNFIVDKLKEYKPIKLELIHTGVDSQFFKPPSLQTYYDLRKREGISDDTIVYIFIANLIHRKNPQILVEAISELSRTSNKKIHLFMMGDGPLMSKCKFIDNGQNITYLGDQPDTRPYLKISDFYISPSLSEGFPTAVLEALAMGIPCILSDIPPHLEMLSGLEDAMFFKTGDIDSLKKQILLSLEKDLTIEKEKAREYFYHNFSADIMAGKLLNAYNKILN